MTMENYFWITMIWGVIMLGAGWYMGSQGFASLWTTISTDISNLKTDVSNLKVTVNAPAVITPTGTATVTTHPAVPASPVLPRPTRVIPVVPAGVAPV